MQSTESVPRKAAAESYFMVSMHGLVPNAAPTTYLTSAHPTPYVDPLFPLKVNLFRLMIFPSLLSLPLFAGYYYALNS